MDRDELFDELVERFSEPLFRFAVSLSRTSIDAEDLVQQTFLTWAEKGHQLQDRTKAKSWLFTTLHRAYLGGQRRVIRFPHVELEEAEAELPVISPDLIERLDGETAVELLGLIDPQYHAAVALFYLEDHSYPEIAEMLEIPLGTVKSRIARGVAQLKAELARRTAAGTKLMAGGIR